MTALNANLTVLAGKLHYVTFGVITRNITRWSKIYISHWFIWFFDESGFQSSPDTWQDWEMASDFEELCLARALLPAGTAWAVGGGVCGVLQPPAISRKPGQRNPSRCVLWQGWINTWREEKNQRENNPKQATTAPTWIRLNFKTIEPISPLRN